MWGKTVGFNDATRQGALGNHDRTEHDQQAGDLSRLEEIACDCPGQPGAVLCLHGEHPQGNASKRKATLAVGQDTPAFLARIRIRE